MKIKALGHVVIRVTDRSRAEAFYGGVLGLPVCARLDRNGTRMTFFSLGDHHNFAVMEVSGEGSSHAVRAIPMSVTTTLVGILSRHQGRLPGALASMDRA